MLDVFWGRFSAGRAVVTVSTAGPCFGDEEAAALSGFNGQMGASSNGQGLCIRVYLGTV